MAEHSRRLGCLMKMSHHRAGVGIIEKIDHRAMAAGNENSVILIQARCYDIRDASWIFEPSQCVAEFQIVLKPGLVPAEEIGDSRIDIQLRRAAFGVRESDFVAFLHQGANRNRQFVEIVASAGINLAIFQWQAVTARDQHQDFSFSCHSVLLFEIESVSNMASKSIRSNIGRASNLVPLSMSERMTVLGKDWQTRGDKPHSRHPVRAER